MIKLIEKLKKGVIVTSESSVPAGRSEMIGSLFFAFVALILTTVNILKHVELAMTIATSVLFAGFLLVSFLAYKKILNAAKLLIIILCGAIFTMFALIGGNDGFAILWILLVPVIGSLWVGFKYGMLLSAYFQIFLFVLFYTPLSETVKDYYSATFMLRFPLLYFASFGSISFLMFQRETLFKKLHNASYFDALTGLHNRRYYNELSAKIKAEGMTPGFTVFSFDLNRLKYANDTYGHQAGDELLKAAAGVIDKNCKNAECFRTGGDEFVAFSTHINPTEAILGLKKDASVWKGEFMPSMSISVGFASLSEFPGKSFDELVIIADERMYKDKECFYQATGLQKR